MSSDQAEEEDSTMEILTDMVDVTELFEEAANSLSVTNPMLCNQESFNLQDSMAALELMDTKMDCCEIPASQVAPFGVKVKEEKLVYPRPAPRGLDDIVDPLPWDDLTIQDASYIALESLVRLESLLYGSSVVESTFTCLYAHRPVVEDMKARLELTDLTEQMESIMKPAQKGSTAQHVVYASTRILLELTDVIRGIIMNADIYEEEDFTVTTYGMETFEDNASPTVLNAVAGALEMVAGLENQQSVEVRAIKSILGYQVDLLGVCSSLARLAGNNVRKKVEQAQKLAKEAAALLEPIDALAKTMKQEESDHTKALIRRTFDSYVNRPQVGNAPVRKIMVRNESEAITHLTTITKEMDWALCQTLLTGNTMGRIRRMIGRLSGANVNILSRSLLVLNLYFDDKLFGQYPLTEMIVKHMQQLIHIPNEVFGVTCSQAFLSRLAKPIYDVLKVQVLNRNRQRAYIEAVMLHDWAALRQEAHIVDMTLKKDSRMNPQMPPHFSLYVFYITIELMDHFVALGVELNLFCDEHELGVAYWYRDFLLSALLNQLATMRKSKLEAKQAQEAATAKSHRGKKKGGKNKKHNNVNSRSEPTPEDMEDEFEYLLLNLKRLLCRGAVRFLAAVNQAGLAEERVFEHSTSERVFAKRFEAFSPIQQPPPLQYADYLAGSDFSKVSQGDLLTSTSECFSASKTYVDQLISQIPSLNTNYLPMQEKELRSIAKVCIGNSVYVQKLRQAVDRAKDKAEGGVSIDCETHTQFCTIKIN